MICPKCGDKLPEDAKACQSCGWRVTSFNDRRRIIAILAIAIILLILFIIGLYFSNMN